MLPASLRLVNIIGDGNCLLRAARQSLVPHIVLPPDHVELRAACAQAIQDNVELSSSFSDNHDSHFYISNMKVDGTFGDEACVRAFVFFFSVSLHC